MFERYTEKARRIIFFGRFEASAFGSAVIESEHLLLGLLREDKDLAQRLLKTDAAIDSVRLAVEARSRTRPAGGASVDLPLSHECKRILAYANEEAERLRHRHIAPEHLAMGMLREENGRAAQLLRERGVLLDDVRQLAGSSRSAEAESSPAAPHALAAFLAERQKSGDITVAADITLAGRTVDLAVYEGRTEVPYELRARIARIVKDMEAAIGRHDFEQARRLSAEESGLRAQLGAGAPDPVPFLCILMAGAESFSRLRARADACLRAGAPDVWILDAVLERAYTVTPADGLREVTGQFLRVAQPSLELDWKQTLRAQSV